MNPKAVLFLGALLGATVALFGQPPAGAPEGFSVAVPVQAPAGPWQAMTVAWPLDVRVAAR